MTNLGKSTNYTFGVVNAQGEHIDVSHSEKGAKNFATRHGYNRVSLRYHVSLHVVILSDKIGKKWYKSQ